MVTIKLASDVEAFLHAQVQELEAWLLEAADKPTTPLTPEDFEAIRQRVLARLRNP